MDANAATIIAGVLGAIIGGPAGFFIERVMNRPRLKISYAEAAYEDIYRFPGNVHQKVLRLTDFIQFVDAQVSWSIKQRLTGNLFNREELRLIREFGNDFEVRLRDYVNQVKNNILPMLQEKGADVEKRAAEFESDYKSIYGTILSYDLKQDRDATISKLVKFFELSLSRVELSLGFLDEFLKQTEAFVDRGRGTSDRVIIRIAIGNTGYQDAIIQTEARLQAGDGTLKTPMQTASRPWEQAEARGPSQFYVINPKAFLVLEFVVDENLNAPKDIQQLKKDLVRGVSATLQTVGMGGETAASHSFVAQLS